MFHIAEEYYGYKCQKVAEKTFSFPSNYKNYSQNQQKKREREKDKSSRKENVDPTACVISYYFARKEFPFLFKCPRVSRVGFLRLDELGT